MKQILAITSSKKGLATLFILQSIVGGFLGLTLVELMEVSNGYGILDFSFGYSLAEVHNTFQAYGTQGMQLYTQVQWIDLVNPLLYSYNASEFVLSHAEKHPISLLALFSWRIGLY